MTDAHTVEVTFVWATSLMPPSASVGQRADRPSHLRSLSPAECLTVAERWAAKGRLPQTPPQVRFRGRVQRAFLERQGLGRKRASCDGGCSLCPWTWRRPSASVQSWPRRSPALWLLSAQSPGSPQRLAESAVLVASCQSPPLPVRDRGSSFFSSAARHRCSGSILEAQPVPISPGP